MGAVQWYYGSAHAVCMELQGQTPECPTCLQVWGGGLFKDMLKNDGKTSRLRK